MWLLYLLVQNFGFAVILFTFAVRGATFPLTLKQQRNMAVSQLFTPRVQEIQRKYRNDSQKMQAEMAKLQKEGYNPMGGCGTMILTLVILFGVIDVVYKPMTHLEHFDWVAAGQTDTVKNIGKETDYATVILGSEADKQLILDLMDEDKETELRIGEGAAQVVLSSDAASAYTRYTGGVTLEQRETIGKYVLDNYDALINDSSRLSVTVKNELKTASSSYLGYYGELAAIQAYSKNPEAFGGDTLLPEIKEKMDRLSERMIFFGLDLGEVPRLAWEPLLIIPIISFLFSAVQMVLSQWIQKKSMPDMAKMSGGAGTSMKVMLYIMPLFSLFISFTVPAGAGFYWAVSYLVGIAQSVIMYIFWPPEKMREQARAKMKNKMPVITATVETVTEGGEVVVQTEQLSNLSKKEQDEYFRRKLEEARRADREKYGDDDL
jgi:YidC/Oxa1 family membrane protein insertase